MALPLIIPPLLAIVGACGAGKVVKALLDSSKANDINNDAKNMLDEAREKLKEARTDANNSLQKFGKKKASVYVESFAPFVQEMRKIKNIELIKTSGFTECLHCSPQELIKELEVGVSFADELLSGGACGALAGAMSAFGAYGAATMFGATASGTAISTLGGVAATNATLAWLGGGAVAAGGFGVAGGAIVLGVLAAAPALALMGFIMGNKASANLDRAYSNLAEAKKMREELDMVTSACKGISSRVRSFISVMNRLNTLMMMGNVRLTQIVTNEGVDYSRYDDDSKGEVAKIVSTAKALKTMLDIALLKKDGSLNDEAEIALREAKNYLTLNQGI